MIHASPTTFAVVGVVATLAVPAQAATAHVSLATLTTQVSAPSDELAYSTVQAKIEAWTRLPHDWDGNDGEPLSQEAAYSATNFLVLMHNQGLPAPCPHIAGDGEAILRWETARGFASVSFLSDGHVVAFVRPTQGRAYGLDEPFSPLFPVSALIDQIRTIA